jgi:hypothetical protein
MALNVDHFYSCTLCERIDIINKSGEYITGIHCAGCYVSLYVVEGTFVEVYCDIHTLFIEDVETMDPDNERLHMYAQQVDLSDLFRVEY